MDNQWRDSIKELMKKIRGVNRQYLLLGLLALIGIAMLVYSPQPKNQSHVPLIEQPEIHKQESKPESHGMALEEQKLADKLEAMLNQVNGAGEVKVSVRLATSSQTNYAIDKDTMERTTREEDQAGGNRTITETTERDQLVLVQGSQGNQQAVIEREIASDIAGVLIIAQGASNPEVKSRLFQASHISLGVDPHKVVVLPMERSGASD